MKNAIMLLPAGSRDALYHPADIAQIQQLVNLTDCSEQVGELETLRPILAETHIIFSGWGMMELNEEFLAATPKLEAILYAAGSVRYFATEAFWKRNILLTSAYAASAIPVAEYTIAAIVFGSKHAITVNAAMRREHVFRVRKTGFGLYGARIGVIGSGMVGTGVLERLQDFSVETFCYDPYLTEERAAELKTTKMELEEIFRTCDVVTLHAPSIPATAGMITGAHLRSMKEGAIFINTARGAIVREQEMIEVLREGKIFAFIDVTEPEPPAAESPLFELPNVFLTPHFAGSCGNEGQRQGAFALEELRRYLKGEAPRYPINQEMMERMA
jgi:phosphoglycerate dehydrogenase-like enzyme